MNEELQRDYDTVAAQMQRKAAQTRERDMRMPTVDFGEELKWLFRISVAVAGILGGSVMLGPVGARQGGGLTEQNVEVIVSRVTVATIAELRLHEKVVGHPVMVERVRGISEDLAEVDDKVDEVLRRLPERR